MGYRFRQQDRRRRIGGRGCLALRQTRTPDRSHVLPRSRSVRARHEIVYLAERQLLQHPPYVEPVQGECLFPQGPDQEGEGSLAGAPCGFIRIPPHGFRNHLQTLQHLTLQNLWGISDGTGALWTLSGGDRILLLRRSEER